MATADWSRQEVEAVVDDYLAMLSMELAGVPYSKTEHRRRLLPKLNGRSPQSVEFKHCNISAALLENGMPPIAGYKPRGNFQHLIIDVLAERLAQQNPLHTLAAADADRPIVVPEVDDILAVLTGKPAPATPTTPRVADAPPVVRLPTNYLEREAHNRSLGDAGEQFTLNYERARLIAAGQEPLAARIEHTAKVRGDHEGYDILSFEPTGLERLIEVKTTQYGIDTPFFVSRNEVARSERDAALYQVYRLFAFREAPKLYTLPGAISQSCQLSAATFLARVR